MRTDRLAIVPRNIRVRQHLRHHIPQRKWPERVGAPLTCARELQGIAKSDNDSGALFRCCEGDELGGEESGLAGTAGVVEEGGGGRVGGDEELDLPDGGSEDLVG